MCKNCYHRRGREKTANNCEHADRPLYAKGLCKPCYQTNYCRAKNISNKIVHIHDKKEIPSNKTLKIFSNLPKKNTQKIDPSFFMSEVDKIEEAENSLKNFDSCVKKFKIIEEDGNRSTLIHEAEKLNKNKNFKISELSVNKSLSSSILKDKPFKIFKTDVPWNNSSFNNLYDINKIENLNFETFPGINSSLYNNDNLNSTNNANKDVVNLSGDKLKNSEDNIANYDANNLLINMSNNNNNNILNNFNLQSYLNNMISNNFPYYAGKGLFQNNIDEYSFIEDFCGNFFQNNNPNYLVDSNTDSKYSDLGEF